MKNIKEGKEGKEGLCSQTKRFITKRKRKEGQIMILGVKQNKLDKNYSTQEFHK